MEFYKIVGILLVAVGAFDMIVIPKLLARSNEVKKTPFVTSVIWVSALVTMLFGLLCFFGVLGEF